MKAPVLQVAHFVPRDDVIVVREADLAHTLVFVSFKVFNACGVPPVKSDFKRRKRSGVTSAESSQRSRTRHSRGQGETADLSQSQPSESFRLVLQFELK